ncbi:hypothetical protein BGW36DRAFT_288853 [Talaromyces proteolyticus]|uniref:chitinase n=1 Tax=Talaromyces proteolyticus TaxID=1131652 RepID=A0AAD4L597_9EURO|nr:uncharacterized protein BGW36DRAFT_288853 [Talaromyces proteolyticus]KAH8703812.1 hypothetical protein BGW36DRAFT_288853 [Talaromyces proteolyticus]
MPSLWVKLGFGVVSLFSDFAHAYAQLGGRLPASPGYLPKNPCPGRCSTAGPNPGNWSLYHNLDQIESCDQTMFYYFSLLGPVDDPRTSHRIYSCSSYGPDWSNLPNVTGNVALGTPIDSTYQFGTGNEGGMSPSYVRSLSRQIREYLANGYGGTNSSVILFARAGKTSVGVYMGRGLQIEATGNYALTSFESAVASVAVGTGTVAMQLCQPGNDGDHVFGIMATSNSTFDPIQEALKSWSNGQCWSFRSVTNITGPAYITTPLVLNLPQAQTPNSTTKRNSMPGSSYKSSSTGRPQRRNTCSYIQVASGDGCYSLSQKCGITQDQLSEYNPSDPKFCSDLQPGEYVCCSEGTLPNFAPQPNSDGSCATYTVKSDDYCSAIAAANSITVDELTNYNADTWSWNGCDDLFVGIIICLSTGTPPMPAAVTNALCGPTVPGTPTPPGGTNISMLNPCLLNACCDVWGQCGTTVEFCVNTNTGSPGTAALGTNGCISNCGTDIISGDAPAVWRTVAYFEGFGFDRACLYQDAMQIDPTGYTNLHFGFGVLNPNYSVDTTFGDDSLSAFEFSQFLRITGPAKILSFGGWAFSTDPSTYMIFRDGVTSANAKSMATNMANFIIQNNLDGIDIDWEYPGAPDIPGIPPASSDDGANYLTFLTILKSLLPNKTVSIAAPSSYWYLKNFPIQKIAAVVDYIIFMTYDLHGQWDASNSYSQDGCPTGNCLRSDVNLTETLNALSMITKAGVPSSQVVVGVTSYGRSFEMSDASCWTENCTFTGSSTQSNAEEGPCTATAGYIANAEIQDILNDPSRVNQNFVDDTSNTNILVYDNVQWVGYMDNNIKALRTSLYKSLNMGGSTDWATDLETYNNVPYPATSWTKFISDIKSAINPLSEQENITGNWTSVQCTDPAINYWVQLNMTSEQRWSEMDGDDAWADVTNQWINVDRPQNKITFISSIVNSLHGRELTKCQSVGPDNNCQTTDLCWFDPPASDGSPPAGAASYEIYNSLIVVHDMYQDIWDALWHAASIFEPSLSQFENIFAPVAPQKDDSWLQILLDFITLGATALAAPIFNSYLTKLPYFFANPAALATTKDLTYAAIAAGVTVGKDVVGGQNTTIGTWSVQDQNAFSTYMGQIVGAWANLTALALKDLFSGSSSSLPNLDSLVTGGKLIAGIPETDQYPPDAETLISSITSALYAYAIPAIWSAARYNVFVIDSGSSCGTINPITKYMTTEDQEASWGCYPSSTGELYYLAMPVSSQFPASCGSNPPDGRCPEVPFTAPPGLSALTGDTQVWGAVTRQLIIQGAVRSYQKNNNANGGIAPDLGDKLVVNGLIDGDYTVPGFINIPVCSPEMAATAVDASSTTSGEPNYPCAVPPSPNDCGTSTFTDATSGGSPLVSDCQQIVTNIAGTQGSWEVESSVGKQHQLVQYGTCAFGVTGTTGTGDVDFHVGAQDIVDLINSSIKMFASNGLVGASGNMACQGDAGNDNVNWGLYHA